MSTVESPIRAVFDCNVLLQAMANPLGPAGACLDCVRGGSITLFITPPIVAELLDVAGRPVLIRKLALTREKTTEFVDDVLACATLFESVPSVYVHPKDPKDSMYVDLAIAAGAHVITSHDRHLLSLRNADDPIGFDFISRFTSLEILTPAQLLKRVQNP